MRGLPDYPVSGIDVTISEKSKEDDEIQCQYNLERMTKPKRIQTTQTIAIGIIIVAVIILGIVIISSLGNKPVTTAAHSGRHPGGTGSARCRGEFTDQTV